MDSRALVAICADVVSIIGTVVRIVPAENGIEHCHTGSGHN